MQGNQEGAEVAGRAGIAEWSGVTQLGPSPSLVIHAIGQPLGVILCSREPEARSDNARSI